MLVMHLHYISIRARIDVLIPLTSKTRVSCMRSYQSSIHSSRHLYDTYCRYNRWAWLYSEERRESLPKKSKVMVYLSFIKW